MMDRRLFVASALAAFAPAPTAMANEFGAFSGEFVGRFIREGVAVVEEPLTFTAASGETWTALKGTEVDGASIPRPLWSIVGSPFTGGYLRAAIIHDHYCVTKERDWRATHYVFYLACRADGLSAAFAKLLYIAVMKFGPRWGVDRADGQFKSFTPAFDQGEFEELRRYIEAEDPSIRDINRRVL